MLRLLVLIPLICQVFASERLRESDLVLPGLLQGDHIPVDPDGHPKRTSGYFRLNRTSEAEMFYFYFESRTAKSPNNDPVVLWMTGGPGCSSELAVFYENGPFRINDDLTISEREHGWDVGHNLIFVDQPIGTGFSYTNDPADDVYDEKGVAHDMLDFVLEFLEAHPELADNEVYITGESYAGHYVPAVARRLWRWNKERGPGGIEIKLRGFAIGNGLTDPAIQYGAYGDFALDNKLIDQTVHDRIKLAYPACKAAIELCNSHNWITACRAALAYCQTAVFGQVLSAAGGVNVYDIRKQCEGPLCYDFSLLDRYLAREDVRKALGVGHRHWSTCDSTVHYDMLGDWMKDYAMLLPEMLEDGVRAMIYAGDKDLICNWLGNRRWVDSMAWESSAAWAAAKDFEWSNKGETAGSVRAVGPLTFVKVYDAGHMVPMDQASNALDMLTRFTRNATFENSASTKLPLQRSLPTRKQIREGTGVQSMEA